jgi:RNA polymerase sigma-70 factor (ECF subfamily)
MNKIRPDDRLISRLRGGDRDAFWEICQFYYDSMLSSAKRWVKDDADARDIVSESFLRLWNHFQKEGILQNPRAFLLVIIRNASIDHLRSRKRHKNAHAEIRHLSQEAESSGDYEHNRAEVLKETRLLLETLSPKRREVMRLIFFMEKTTTEVAEQLGISTATVLVHKSDSIKILRELLRKKGLLFPF